MDQVLYVIYDTKTGDAVRLSKDYLVGIQAGRRARKSKRRQELEAALAALDD